MPPRYSRNRHPLWLRFQMLQIWINEKQYLMARQLNKAWLRLPFNRGRAGRNPSCGPRLLTNPVVVGIIVIVLVFLLVFGEGLLNTGQIVEMMTGVKVGDGSLR